MPIFKLVGRLLSVFIMPYDFFAKCSFGAQNGTESGIIFHLSTAFPPSSYWTYSVELDMTWKQSGTILVEIRKVMAFLTGCQKTRSFCRLRFFLPAKQG